MGSLHAHVQLGNVLAARATLLHATSNVRNSKDMAHKKTRGHQTADRVTWRPGVQNHFLVPAHGARTREKHAWRRGHAQAARCTRSCMHEHGVGVLPPTRQLQEMSGTFSTTMTMTSDAYDNVSITLLSHSSADTRCGGRAPTRTRRGARCRQTHRARPDPCTRDPRPHQAARAAPMRSRRGGP